MSHVAKVNVEVKDLDALKATAQLLGLEFREGQTTYKWFGRHVGDYKLPRGFKKEDLGKCDHALVIPGDTGAYEIGVVARKDGKPGYELLWDFWGGGYGLTKKIGQKGEKLINRYTVEAGKNQFRRQGFRFIETVGADGTITVKATR